MNDNDVAAGRVVAVLLADGWHRIVRGSFSVGPLGLGVDPGVPGFHFEEADIDRPREATVLVGPLDSIIAVRQVTPGGGRRLDDSVRPPAAHNGPRAYQGARRPARIGC